MFMNGTRSEVMDTFVNLGSIISHSEILWRIQKANAAFGKMKKSV